MIDKCMPTVSCLMAGLALLKADLGPFIDLFDQGLEEVDLGPFIALFDQGLEEVDLGPFIDSFD